ncbi:MAG TPA: RNA-binding protein [Verrucomicrobia subdivision 3 bacterium]|nr:RNA-binding protein [Limisphaerales bacterium]
MISNERPSPYGRQPYPSHSYGAPKFGQPKPFVQEDTLKSAEVQIERKFFVLTLKENPRGRFLRITEDVGGRRDTIIIPSTGLADFKKLVDEMVKASEEIPLKNPNPSQSP